MPDGLRQAAFGGSPVVATDAAFTSVAGVRSGMTLETLDPDAADATEFDPAVLDALAADDYRFKVWGRLVWRLSATAPVRRGAAPPAGGVPDDRIEDFPVTKGPNGKEGEGVDEYEIELIPTDRASSSRPQTARRSRGSSRRQTCRSPSTSRASLRA